MTDFKMAEDDEKIGVVEDEVILNKFGIDCYLHKRPVIRGTIKSIPEDFVVKEISLDNKVVDFDFIPSSSSNSFLKGNNATARTHEYSLKRSSTVAEANTDEKRLKLDVQDEIVINTEHGGNNPSEMLRELLDEKWLTEIRNLMFCSGPTDNVSVEFPAFESKEKRRLLYWCLRYEFPCLAANIQPTNDQSMQNNRVLVIKKDATFDEFCTILGKDVTNAFFIFIHCHRDEASWIKTDAKANDTFDLITVDDKAKRTELHRLISRHFGTFLESKTHSDMEKGYIINVRRRQKGNRSSKTSVSNIAQVPVFSHFVLRKRNFETLNVVNRLAAELNVKPSYFCFAGIKDKKAVTYQQMCVKDVPVVRIEKLNNSEVSDITIRNCQVLSKPLHQGDLLGNKFCITIRDVSCAASDGNVVNHLREAAHNVSTEGFLNYFGPQRFGLESNDVNSCDIGRSLLQGNMRKTVDLLFSPNNTSSQADLAKKYFQDTEDVSGTIKIMPHGKTREMLVLKALHRHGLTEEGCAKAICNIPYSMRLFYVHSYCSLIWNRILSKRILTYGKKVIPGDLILMQESDCKMTQGASDPIIACEDYVKQHSDKISQVVLPLPGWKVKYPENIIADWYVDMMKDDNITPDSFKMKTIGLTVPGTHRRIISKASSLHWLSQKEDACSCSTQCSHRTVSDESDKHDLLGYELPSCDTGKNIDDPLHSKSDTLPGCVSIEFELSSSSYATVCLREIINV